MGLGVKTAPMVPYYLSYLVVDEQSARAGLNPYPRQLKYCVKLYPLVE